MSDPNEIRSRIIGKLCALGETTEEVAGALRVKGMTGLRGFGDSCPVFHYLATELPDLDIRHVDVYAVWRDPDTGNELQALLPDPVVDFVDEFDSGQHPDLVEVAS